MTRALTSGRRAKYGAQPCVIDGIRFASKREGARYLELRLLERAGEIRDLELQPPFPLLLIPLYAVPGPRLTLRGCGEYRADFQYVETRTGEVVVEDVKGFDVPLGTLKRKLTEVLYGVPIRVIQ